jgi:hypothetical protein
MMGVLIMIRRDDITDRFSGRVSVPEGLTWRDIQTKQKKSYT